MTLQSFAKSRPQIFWSTKSFQRLSDEAIVEGILQYGDFDDVQKVISILGKKETADIFYRKVEQGRHNFDPKIENYFKLYFKDVSRNTDR